jgi:hypothetical protein
MGIGRLTCRAGLASIIPAAIPVAIVTAATETALALCPMCKASIENAENAKELSRTIDGAVLVLLVPTLLIICGLIRLVYKYRHADGDDADSDSSTSINSYVDFRSSNTQRNLK